MTPTIKIKYDQEKEIEFFHKFLNHPEFPQHRSMILDCYPQLEKDITENGEEIAISKFIESFHTQHKQEIDQIINESQKQLENYKTALEILGQIMNHQWAEQTIYTARPTILPFSPFENNEFHFSVLNQLFNQHEPEVLYIAIHEISHFIFFDQLKQIEQTRNLKFDRDLIYYFKESLTTVILNEPNMKNLLNKNQILGNRDIRDINLKINDKTISLIDYLKQNLERNENFVDTLGDSLLKLNKYSSSFNAKRKFLNKHGSKIFQNQELLDTYREPIIIQ